MADCTWCNGAGIIECPYCGTEDALECDNCGGTGQEPNYDEEE